MAEAEHTIQIPPKLIPVFVAPNKRIRGAFGGRGSAKTRSFAKMAAVRGVIASQAGREGIILCCREFMNSLDDSSLMEVKAAIESDEWLKSHYDVGEKYIRTRDRRVSFKFAGLRHNINSIKSKAKILLCWIDEADPVSDQAWEKLIPSVREDDSEIWVTWNPENPRSRTEARFRNSPDDDVAVVELNWRDNPWFPSVLERERRVCERDNPEEYEHIWDGAHRTSFKGSYYAKGLLAAKRTDRIAPLSAEPNLRVYAHWDIGGPNKKADAMTVVVNQWVQNRIHVLDYIEGQGQMLAYYLTELRNRGWDEHLKPFMVLPHDAGQTHADNPTGMDFEAQLKKAGYQTKKVHSPSGAVLQRIKTTQQLFTKIWFNKSPYGGELDRTLALRQALAWYHEKRSDDEREIGLGPDHDWSSHAADAFGMMCIDYKEPAAKIARPSHYQTSDTVLG
jgi:phage terminase large subunit